MIYSLTLTRSYPVAFTMTPYTGNPSILIATQGGVEAGLQPAGIALNANFKYLGSAVSGILSSGISGTSSTSGIIYTDVGNISIGSGTTVGFNASYCMLEGISTTVNGSAMACHVEGISCTGIGNGCHVEGTNNTISGSYSHAEGQTNTIYGKSAHIEGVNNTIGINANFSHVEGNNNIVSGVGSHAEGEINIIYTNCNYCHAEGGTNTISGGCSNSHVEGNNCTIAGGNYAHAEGYYSVVTADYSHAEGNQTITSGLYTHAEGYLTTASGLACHVEGTSNTGLASYCHAEGANNIININATGSHAQGNNNNISGIYCSVEGYTNSVSGIYNHVEGTLNTVNNIIASHIEGSGHTGAINALVHKAIHVEGVGHLLSSVDIGSTTGIHLEGYNSLCQQNYTHTEGRYASPWVQGMRAASNAYIKYPGDLQRTEITMASYTTGLSGQWAPFVIPTPGTPLYATGVGFSWGSGNTGIGIINQNTINFTGINGGGVYGMAYPGIWSYFADVLVMATQTGLVGGNLSMTTWDMTASFKVYNNTIKYSTIRDWFGTVYTTGQAYSGITGMLADDTNGKRFLSFGANPNSWLSVMSTDSGTGTIWNTHIRLLEIFTPTGSSY